MNSSKVVTQKNLSALLGLALAVTTLFQAVAMKSSESSNEPLSKLETELLMDAEQMLSTDIEELIVEDFFIPVEVTTPNVKVFDESNVLVAEGDPSTDSQLRELVRSADFLTETSTQKYYRISK